MSSVLRSRAVLYPLPFHRPTVPGMETGAIPALNRADTARQAALFVWAKFNCHGIAGGEDVFARGGDH
jgi:hypothetical protein